MFEWLINIAFGIFSAGLLIMIVQMIFKHNKRTAQSMLEGVHKAAPKMDQQPPSKKRSVCVLGVDATGREKGIFYDERVHMAVFGFPGTGKTRFLLSLALQDIWEGRGCMIIDPHGDLSRLVLRYIPRERWNDVIYIDPATALKYGRVVKVNFLEYKDPKDRGVVARSFMDSLEKIYSRHWGPRLDLILMNAIYLLLDSGDRNVSNLYKVIADESYREMLLSRVADQNVISFWTNEYPTKMPKDASSAVLTKIYRLVQERIVAPMFDCDVSRIDFRKAMDEERIVIVNLSEGEITSDVANFLGSLILSRVYLAGMSREDIPENMRKPFYVYVDEAYRFVTESIRDILQSLRKYKVYMTLASQFLDQYAPSIAKSIPSLCDTIVSFSIGEQTARALAEFYKPTLTYTDLVRLPRYHFAVSAIVEGRREVEVLKTIDFKEGPYDPEEVIKYSLERWGDEVDMRKYTGTPTTSGLPHPSDLNMKPLSWIILVTLYKLYEEEFKKGGGISTESKYPGIGREDLVEYLKNEFEVNEADVDEALTYLFYNGWIDIREVEVKHEAAEVYVDPPYQSNPIKCAVCDLLTHRPFILRDGRGICKPCLEKLLYTKSISADSILKPMLSDNKYSVYPPKQVRVKRTSYALKPEGLKRFFEHLPKGRRGGGPEHVRAVLELARSLIFSYAFCFIDTGEEEYLIKEDGSIEYVIRGKPDIIVYPLIRNPELKSGWDPRQWDNTHPFFIEVEMDPFRGKNRILKNLAKCRDLGKPVIFATTRGEWAKEIVKILLEAGEKIVYDCSGFFGGKHEVNAASVLYIDLESGTRIFVTSPDQPLSAREIEEKREPLAEPKEVKFESEVTGDPQTILLGFSDWRLTVKREGEEENLYASKNVSGKILTVKLGSYMKFKELLEKFEINYSFEEPAEEPPAKKAAEAAVKEEEKPGEKTPQKEAELVKPKETFETKPPPEKEPQVEMKEKPKEEEKAPLEAVKPPEESIVTEKAVIEEGEKTKPAEEAEEGVQKTAEKTSLEKKKVEEEKAEGRMGEEKKQRRPGRRSPSLAEVEERIVTYLVEGGYKLDVRPTSGGRFYLRAVKGGDQQGIGPLTEETKKLLEKYGIKLQ